MNTEASNENTVDIVFEGAILTTLTEHLPNDLAAFKELIKNAYDASADCVSISLDSAKRLLIIQDDGDGMNKEGLENLFRVGKSQKQYGHEFKSTRSQEIRYFQGSKGVGFLSAMHFGNDVVWSSSKGDGEAWELRCKLSDLTAMKDLREAKIPIGKSQFGQRGTRIEICLDDYHLKNVSKCFNDDIQVAKICNSFRASSMSIFISVDGIRKNPEKIGNLEKLTKNDIFYVKIFQPTGEVKLYNGDEVACSFDIPYDGSRFKLDGEILIYDLTGQNARRVTSLFWNDNESLTPLIYINNCLFDDYSLFNPEIYRKKKGSLSLPQMLGYIDIRCCDPELQFTSERTRLYQNELSDTIRSTLLYINEQIQTRGSKYKEEQKVNGKSLLKKSFNIPDVSLEAAYIRVRANRAYNVPSEQIDLRKDLLIEACNSKRQTVPFEEIEVKVNGEESDTGILPSQVAVGSVEIEYSFTDESTGKVCKGISLEFRYKSLPKEKVPKRDLFEYMPRKTKSPHMQTCARLMGDLNTLVQLRCMGKYKEVVACCLRAVYELSVTSLKNNSDAPEELRRPGKPEAAIKKIMKYIQGNRDDIAPKSSVVDYDSLKNIDLDEFENNYKCSHMGAHKGTSLLTNEKMYDIAKTASIFATLVSELISHEKS